MKNNIVNISFLVTQIQCAGLVTLDHVPCKVNVLSIENRPENEVIRLEFQDDKGTLVYHITEQMLSNAEISGNSIEFPCYDDTLTLRIFDYTPKNFVFIS